MPSAGPWLAAVFLLLQAHPRGLDGGPLGPFEPAGPATVLFFVTSDCPVSNGYAPEIRRVCETYARRGVRCVLAYEDVAITAQAARSHRQEYGLETLAATIDADRALAARAGATVTPSAVLLDHAGRVRYRGRIDNKYLALGTPRRVVTVRDLRDALDAVLGGRSVTREDTEAVGCFIVPPAGPGS